MNREIKRLDFWMNSQTSSIFEKEMQTADAAFAEFSERGIKPDFSKIINPLRYKDLEQAKIREGQHIAMYEQGILDGSVPYWTLLGGENPKEIPPLEIMKFLSKQLFKGMDKNLIEEVYQKVLNYWTWWRKVLFYLKW